MIFKKNKKAMSIPILLLLILTVVLIITALFYFNIKQKNIKETILVPETIDNVYVKELQLDYYLNDIFERAIEGFKFEDGKQVFISNYLRELGRYRLEGVWIVSDLGQVENQIIENNIELNEAMVSLNLNLHLAGTGEVDKIEVISVKYDYDRKFEKVFKLENV